MIRSFDLRDVSVVQRLHGQGRPLSTHMVMAGGINPLRDAMRGYVAGALDHMICLVERDTEHNVEAFGLMHVLPDESDAEIARQRGAALVLMAPAPTTAALAGAWVYLIQELAAVASERGAHHIVADVQEGSVEAGILQSAGFAALLSQDLLKLTRSPEKGMAHPLPEGARLATRDDDPQIRLLHLRCAPKMTLQAERTCDALFNSMRLHKSWVLLRNNEVVGYIGTWHGRRGRVLQCLFRPDAEGEADGMLRHVLSVEKYGRPTYCCLRHYQNALLPVLAGQGFMNLGSTILMMRHTAVHIRQPVWSKVPAGAVAASKRHKRVSYKLKHDQ